MTKFATRGKPEVIIPEAALSTEIHAVWSLHCAAMKVMSIHNLRQAWVKGHEGNFRRYNRVVRVLFVDALGVGKYDELNEEFHRRLALNRLTEEYGENVNNLYRSRP